MKGKTVFVGMSGGVDSSVAALRLKKQGYKVVGVFIKVWHPDFLVCNWEEERLDAMRVAAHLEIPFLTCDAEAAYRDEVAHYFINEYLSGRTPNPDVMCNKHVKFGAFIKFAKKHKADFIATGHYVQKIDSTEGELHRGLDTNKDQSYFLYSLTKEQLDFSLFPVGDTAKEGIRKEATAAKLPTAAKKDSQGVCFLGHIDIKDFLSHYVDLKKGLVIDGLTGKVIGEHDGALIYTIGQRHGFSVSTHSQHRNAYYVTAKDVTNNTITVSTEQPIQAKSSGLMITKSIIRTKLEVGQVLEAQTRYRQKPFRVRVESIAFDQIELELIDKSDAVAIGQSCVLYRGTHCIGGGIIT
jgi:tRNA-specific 2-thiouridylase